MTNPDFPILGTEPLPVEFANTLYGQGEDRTDFLRTAQWIDQWFALISEQHTLAISSAVMSRDAERVRILRGCVHHLLSSAVDGTAPDTATINRVNDFAQTAPTHLRLYWPDGGAPTARWHDTTTGTTAVLGRIATCCIELLTGPQAGALQRCQGPGCSLLFIKNHSRRRWCHPSCGHRDRQARYYRRHHSQEVPR